MKQRLLVFPLLVSALVLFAAAVFAGFLVSTETGLHWMLPLIKRRLPGSVSFASVHGRLIGPLEVNGLHYRNKKNEVAVNSLYLNWSPYFLTSGEIYITNVDVQGVSIISKGEKERIPQPIKLPQLMLPVKIIAQNVRLSNITFSRPGAAPMDIDTVSLAMSTVWNSIYVQHLDVQSRAYRMHLAGKINPQGNYPLHITTNWSVRIKDYPGIAGKGEIRGDLGRLIVSQSIRAPVHADLDAAIYNVLRKARWTGKINVKKFAAQEINRKWPVVDLDGVLQGNGDPTFFSINGAINVSRAGFGVVSSSVNLHRTADLWRVDTLVLSMPAAVPAKAVISGEYSKGLFDFHGTWANVRWPFHKGSALLRSSGGDFRIKGSSAGYRLDLGFALSGKGIPEGLWAVSGKGDFSSLSLEKLHAKLLGGELNGLGRLKWKPWPEGEVSLRGKALNPGLRWPDWPGRLALNASLSGKLVQGVLNGAADLRNLQGVLRGYPLRASAQLKTGKNEYRVTAMDIASGDARLSAKGYLTDRWSFGWKIHAPHLGALVPGGRGELSGNGALEGPRNSPLVAAVVSGKGIVFRSYRFDKVRANIQLDLQDRQASHVELMLKGLSVNRRRIESLDLQGRGKISAHKLTVDLSAGGETLYASVRGGYMGKVWQGTLNRSGLFSKEYGQWALEKPGPLVISFSNKNVRAGQWCWNNKASRFCVAADWKGAAGSRVNVLTTSMPLAFLNPFMPAGAAISGIVDGSADVRYTAESLEGKVGFRASHGRITYALPEKKKAMVSLGEVLLDARMDGKMLDAKLTVPLVGGGGIEADAVLHNLHAGWSMREGAKGTLSIKDIPLSAFELLMPPGVRITGRLNGNVFASLSEKVSDARAGFTISAGSISYPLNNRNGVVLAYQDVSFDARLAKNILHASLNAPLTDGGSVAGNVTLTDFSPFAPLKGGRPVRGNLKGEIRELGILQLLFPEVEKPAGILRADGSLAGTVANPLLKGRAALEGGSADVPRLGISLRDTRFSVTSAAGSAAVIEGRVKSGPGEMDVNGTAELKPGEGWLLNARIRGLNFEAVRIPEARVYASPDLNVQARDRTINVTGEVVVPRAAITLKDRSGTVQVSEDVVIVERVKRERQKEKWKIYSKVKIVLGKMVSFSGFGLSGQIKGSVTTTEKPQQVTTATGDLQVVNGKYNAYGQSLAIERGRMSFTGGPVNDPALDVRAVRKAGDVTAGISVLGSLKKPKMNLFSTPAMEQTDILSYLILGRPMESASGAEGNRLYSAARSLSLSGGEFLAKRIGGAFGIRDIRVEPGTKAEEASLFLGAHLSPRLYIGYGIGLFEPISRLRLRYELSRKFQVQVESGTQSGADIFYNIER